MTTRPRHRALGAVSVLPLLTASGCCDLALYLCGPDRSEWVPISWDTPDAGLATFLEAIRRDHLRVLYESLSPGMLERLGITGAVEAGVVWEILGERYPGIHLLGTAEVVQETVLASDRVRYVLERSGRRFAVEVARLAYFEMRYVVAPERSEPLGEYVPSLAPYLRLEGSAMEPEVVLRLPAFGLPESVRTRDLREVTAGHTWRVDGLAEDDEIDGE